MSTSQLRREGIYSTRGLRKLRDLETKSNSVKSYGSYDMKPDLDLAYLSEKEATIKAIQEERAKLIKDVQLSRRQELATKLEKNSAEAHDPGHGAKLENPDVSTRPEMNPNSFFLS
jgi:hypothetical protein